MCHYHNTYPYWRWRARKHTLAYNTAMTCASFASKCMSPRVVETLFESVCVFGARTGGDTRDKIDTKPPGMKHLSFHNLYFHSLASFTPHPPTNTPHPNPPRGVSHELSTVTIFLTPRRFFPTATIFSHAATIFSQAATISSQADFHPRDDFFPALDETFKKG